jgi:hypothetical protein
MMLRTPFASCRTDSQIVASATYGPGTHSPSVFALAGGYP